MDEQLITVLQEISNHLKNIRMDLSMISLWLMLMLCCKEMGHEAGKQLKNIKDRIEKR